MTKQVAKRHWLGSLPRDPPSVQCCSRSQKPVGKFHSHVICITEIAQTWQHPNLFACGGFLKMI